jgi:hypothetical protein
LSLVVVPTGVIAFPPIGVTGGDGPTTEPIAVVRSIVPGTIDPDPRAIPEYPMTIELIVVVAVSVLAFPIVFALPVVTGVWPAQSHPRFILLVLRSDGIFMRPKQQHENAI